jgi:phosphatidylinositol glycan class Z
MENGNERHRYLRLASYGILFLLYLLRFAICFSSGYIHPDEFFQGGQELFFGIFLSEEKDYGDKDHHRPWRTPCSWEWEPEHALRSIFAPWVMTKLPLMVYATLMGRQDSNHVTGMEVLVVPRLWLCLLSFATLDLPVFLLYKQNETHQQSANKHSTSSFGGPPAELLILGSSWTTLLFCTRPFSNALENMLFSILLCKVMNHKRQRSENGKGTRIRLQSAFIVGCILSLGLFTRFTFAFFAAPIVLAFLYNETLKESCDIEFRPKVMAMSLITTTTALTMSFMLMSAFLIIMDTCFYYAIHPLDLLFQRSSVADWKQLSPPVVTPLNFLRYNMNPENVAAHGLHPRYTHAIVNMLLMFGPLALVLYYRMLGYSSKKPGGASGNRTFKIMSCTNVSYATIVSGLVLLSFSPHQEPRFLLPLIVPLTLSCGHFFARRRILVFVWVVFNVILLCLYGFLHQSGVISTLLRLGIELDNEVLPLMTEDPHHHVPHPEAVIFVKTYMPPTFLLRNEKGCQAGRRWLRAPALDQLESNGSGQSDIDDSLQQCSALANPYFLDLKGGTQNEELKQVIDLLLDCSNDSKRHEKCFQGTHVILVSPPRVLGHHNDLCSLHYDCDTMFEESVHLSTEDIDESDSVFSWLQSLTLQTTKIGCK